MVLSLLPLLRPAWRERATGHERQGHTPMPYTSAGTRTTHRQRHTWLHEHDGCVAALHGSVEREARWDVVVLLMWYELAWAGHACMCIKLYMNSEDGSKRGKGRPATILASVQQCYVHLAFSLAFIGRGSELLPPPWPCLPADSCAIMFHSLDRVHALTADI